MRRMRVQRAKLFGECRATPCPEGSGTRGSRQPDVRTRKSMIAAPRRAGAKWVSSFFFGDHSATNRHPARPVTQSVFAICLRQMANSAFSLGTADNQGNDLIRRRGAPPPSPEPRLAALGKTMESVPVSPAPIKDHIWEILLTLPHYRDFFFRRHPFVGHLLDKRCYTVTQAEGPQFQWNWDEQRRA